MVCVHGLWMTGLEMTLLRRRLRACGFEVRQFRYPSVRRAPAENAARLARFVAGLQADIVHFVAHSLGGIVVLHLLARQADLPPGRVVMLGTPLRGSRVARRAAAIPPLRWLLGRSLEQGLLGDHPPWPAGRELAMIAGTSGRGFGRLLLPSLPKPHDGTVAVDETDAPCVRQHLQVPASHFGMLFSAPVAARVCRYLRSGELG